MRLSKNAALCVLFFLISFPALAETQAVECLRLEFKRTQTSKVKIRAQTSRSQMEELFNWELTRNVELFREPNRMTPIDYVHVPASSIEIRAADDVDPKLLEWIQVKTGDGEFVKWPKHPGNTSTEVPYAESAPHGKWPVAKKTASRSIAVFPDNGARPFTFKTGTNYPHPTEMQEKKVDTTNDILGATLRDPYLAKRNREIGRDPDFEVLREPLILVDKKTKKGVIFRDYSALKPGHHYLPALTINSVGPKIAALNQQPFDEFWIKAYSESLGRAKAKLLLNYGLEMVTPNAQNILVELDAYYKPTGRIIFRDISDSKFVKQVAIGIGERLTQGYSSFRGSFPQKSLTPYSSNSHWRFDEGENAIPTELMQKMEGAHDKAYKETIRKALDIPEQEGKSIESIGKWLNTYSGRMALRSYDARLKQAHRGGQ